MKKTRMEVDVNYYLCPDKKCKLWFESKGNPCEYRCPYEDKLIKAIKCPDCGEIIKLPGNHFSWCHFNCNHCDHFIKGRFSNKSHRIFEIKE